MLGDDKHRSPPVESCLVHSRGVFFQKIRFLLWKPIQKQMQPGLIGRIMPSWVKPILRKWRAFLNLMRGWRGDAQLGDAQLGDAHFGPELKAYKT